MEGDVTPPTWNHFRLEPLAEGVWATLHLDGGWSVCNGGIVDLGDRTLVFDTYLTPDAARELRGASLQLTGRVPDVVLNSHYHNDHIRGNEVFPEGVVVSGRRTRELIATKGPEDLENDRANAARSLEAVKKLASSDDLVMRRAARTFIPYWEAMLASTPHVTLRLPDLGVERDLWFYGRRRRALFRVMGGGHTEEDAVLYLPEDGVVFCGDLHFVHAHAYLGHGDPAVLLGILDELEALSAGVLVPGHGPVSGPESLGELRRYIGAVQNRASELAARGAAADEVARDPIPDAFRGWLFAHPFYTANLQFMYERAEARGKETL